MVSQYWVLRNGRTSGPFTATQIRQMASAGMLTVADLVSDDQVNFKPAGRIAGLFPSREIVAPYDLETRADKIDEQLSEEAHADRGDSTPLPTVLIEDPPIRPVQRRPAEPPEGTSPSTARRICCPQCKRTFWAAKSRAKGWPSGTPRFRITFFTGAESVQCPACQAKLMFPMTTLRLCLTAIIWFGMLAYLAYDVVRGAPIDALRLIIVGIITYAVIRDLAMRRRGPL